MLQGATTQTEKPKLKLGDRLVLLIPDAVMLFLVCYLLIAFLSPISFRLGFNQLGEGIQFAYRIFCHQRVERSLFLFGEKPFYSIKELQVRGAIPTTNPNVPYFLARDIFAYPYWGNAEVGYKMPICIRDTGLYVMLDITGLILMIYMKRTGKIKKFPWWLMIALMLPMAVDGVFQTFAEIFRWPWVSVAYIEDVSKRIITGGLFGIGFAMFVFPNLKEFTQYASGIETPAPL